MNVSAKKRSYLLEPDLDLRRRSRDRDLDRDREELSRDLGRRFRVAGDRDLDRDNRRTTRVAEFLLDECRLPRSSGDRCRRADLLLDRRKLLVRDREREELGERRRLDRDLELSTRRTVLV